ncbi:MAG: translocation/assembly module TamB domain-containing protein [Gemmatimonadaceae bacterium]|nr:translocation/assembly module TamB domain-containing protein [Gemmatimonadaceae bacterium]
MMTMTSRQRRFWWAAAILLALGVGLAGTASWFVNSAAGRKWLARTMAEQGSAIFKGRGSLHIGRLVRVGRSGVVADTVMLLDTAGVPVMTASRVEASIRWMGLLDSRIHIPTLRVSGMRLSLRQDKAGTPWNIAYIIAGDTTPPEPKLTPGFGDDVRIDDIALSDGEVTTVAPWEPHPIFTGAARDSVIAVRDSLQDMTRAADGTWFERRVITLPRVRAHDAIIVDPQKRPSSIALDTVVGVISSPPIPLRHASGRVVWTGDSLTFDLDQVRLPASSARAKGLVAWNQPGPVRYSATVHADAGLSDLTWIWDALPSEGRGQAVVHMRTLADANDAEYLLDSLRVESKGSRVGGRIGVTVRPADLLLHSADLTFSPLRDDLLRRLSYDGLPPEVRGTFEGRLVAERGGPLRALPIDLLRMRFTDANASGAVSEVTLRGEVGIGAAPRARNLVADAFTIDLRSVRQFAPDAPAADGRITGNVRLREADLSRADVSSIALQWTDAAGNVSNVRGEDIRARYDREPFAVRGNFVLEPLSMLALARIDTTLIARAPISGRIAVDGSLDALRWNGLLVASATLPASWPTTWPSLASADSTLTPDSLSSMRPPESENVPGSIAVAGTASVRDSSWRASGNGRILGFDVQRWLGQGDMPATAVNGTIAFNAQGTLPADSTIAPLITGRVLANVEQQPSESRPALTLVTSVSADSLHINVDSAVATLGQVLFDARGALGRDSSVTDTLQFSLRADSLETVRTEFERLAAMLQPMDSALAATIRSTAADTLRGDASLSGYLMGNVKVAEATAALGGRALQVGTIQMGRLFGSLRATDVFNRPAFEGAASADDVTGLGAARVQSANFRVAAATPDSGQLVLDVSTVDNAHLVVRGGYAVVDTRTSVTLDSIRLTYDDVTWREAKPSTIVIDSASLSLTPLELRSNGKGVFAVEAQIPEQGAIKGSIRLEDFPAGEVSALLAGTPPANGTITGQAALAGTRLAPTITWDVVGNGLGVEGVALPVVSSNGTYADQRLRASAFIRDSVGGVLRVEGTFPVDLRITEVEKRLLSDVVDGRVMADSLQLGALAFAVDGVRRVRGALSGELTLGGTFDNPNARGQMQLVGAGADLVDLGISPGEGTAVLRAAGDSLIIESLRVRSGGTRDTLGVVGSLRFPSGDSAQVNLRVTANNFEASRQRDGTDLDIGGDLSVQGKLLHPTVSGRIYVPRANLVIDPLGARTALDLTSETAQALLGADEVPVAQTAAQSIAAMGEMITVTNGRLELGNEVWVQTPEARVKLTGGLDVAMSGQQLALDGEILVNRGQYRLDLGVVNRSFTVDSGRVRFFANGNIPPTLDISATNIVRVAGASGSSSTDIPVRVHIGGNLDKPELRMSSSDPLYASAPDSEIISLLIFGAPTFALDGQGQSTVGAVTSRVLLPTFGGVVENQLQRILPGGFNTIEVTTSGGEGSLSAAGLLDNLSISAGKQLGDKTFLRINTGLCRGTAQAASGNSSPWIGLAAEYRISRNLMGQVGVDPGAARCSQLGFGSNARPPMQFGFDLFREWIW